MPRSQRRTNIKRLRYCLGLLRLAAARTSLAVFAAIFLAHLLSNPSSAYHYRLCSELDRALLPGGRLLGAIPREHAKTTLGTVATVLSAACFGTKSNILLIAASRREAEAKLRLIVGELEGNPRLRAAFGSALDPVIDGKGQRIAYSDSEVVLASGVRISTIGFGGKVRGQLSNAGRPDLVILDDPEDDTLARSPERRRKLREWCDQALVSALDLERGSLIWLGTLLHHDSVLAQWMGLKRPPGSWRCLRWAALSDANHPLWPGRWTYARLMQRKSEIGERAFAQEYMNQPVSRESQVLADSDWRIYDPALIERSALGVSIAGLPLAVAAGVDPAIGQGSDHDYFAVVVLGILSADTVESLGPAEIARSLQASHQPAGVESRPLIFVLDVVRERLRFSRQLELLSTISARWYPRVIGVESVAYQQVLAERTRELGLPVRELKARGDKERRIEAAALPVQQGRVYLPAQASWVERFRQEASEFPAGAHDDQLDAFAHALSAGLPLVNSPLVERADEIEVVIDPFAGGPARLSRF